MKIGVPRPTLDGETRVALVPETFAKLKKAGFQLAVERCAGEAAHYSDASYEAAGGSLVSSAAELYDQSDVIVLAHLPTSDQIDAMRSGTILISPLSALTNHDLIRHLAERNIAAFAMELVPRITRAQSMDILSSMSSLAGYKAVLLGAASLGRIFPMMMTAAGTITPAHVLIVGAGVAGLQAIATAKRLGAVVEAYDVRAVVKEQIESLGARFVVVEAPAEDAQDKGGYAKEVSEAYKAKQAEALHKHVRENDVVITTALIPGKPAPKLITAQMVRDMKPGSVIVDLAGEAGGNCELTRYGETVVEHGVTILAPRNLPATLPFNASQAFGKNITAFVLNMAKDGAILFNMEDEIVRETLVTRDGQVVSPRVRQAMGMPALNQQPVGTGA
ncbi:MAG: Re/Si-specific NAD(P)(+) transhydrogenase subunit alpha [Planctomycetota bacterium]